MFKSKVHFSPLLENKTCKFKNAILIYDVLVHEGYIFGKRRSNVTCCKKTPPNLAKWFERYGLLKFKNF
jgi:hypothetical protein